MRALYCMTHGKWALGIRFNPILLLAIPLLVAMAIWPKIGYSRSVAWTVFAVICCYWVLRNVLPVLAQPDMGTARRMLSGDLALELPVRIHRQKVLPVAFGVDDPTVLQRLDVKLLDLADDRRPDRRELF